LRVRSIRESVKRGLGPGGSVIAIVGAVTRKRLLIIMVHIFIRLRNNLFNYTICFDPNESSSGVFCYTSFTIELQREIHTLEDDPVESKHVV
jgi:hypothetical protein